MTPNFSGTVKNTHPTPDLRFVSHGIADASRLYAGAAADVNPVRLIQSVFMLKIHSAFAGIALNRPVFEKGSFHFYA